MLALLAALIPIAGSLFAGASFLIEHAGLRREREVRIRVAAIGEARLPEAEKRADMRDRIEPGVWHSPYAEVIDLEKLLLEAHGYKRPPSIGEADINMAMSGTEASKGERVRQWVLLLTATAGVILLAFDAV